MEIMMELVCLEGIYLLVRNLFLIQLLMLSSLQFVVQVQEFLFGSNEFLVENDLIHFVEQLDVDHF